MSWPQWPGGGVPQPGVVQTPIINPAPNVVNPAATLMPNSQYTPEQWAQMQQQNWQQWAQWQQQFQQWQQQYGAEYQKSISALAQTGVAPVQPPVPLFNSAPPPLPTEIKPPPPPDEPQVEQFQPPTPVPFPSFTAPPPVSQATYSNTPQPPQPAPPKEHFQKEFNSNPNATQANQGGYQNRNRNEGFNQQRFGGNQNYPNNNRGGHRNWQNQNNRNQPGFNDHRFNQPQAAPLNEMETRSDYGVKRPYQSNDAGDPKRNKTESNTENSRWKGVQQHKPRWEAPSSQSENQQWDAKSSDAVAKANPEELTEAEKKFDKQFADWESQFQKWKEQNANHPDKEQYREYEKKWEAWRTQLLDRREQMRRKRLGLPSASPQPGNDKPAQPKPASGQEKAESTCTDLQTGTEKIIQGKTGAVQVGPQVFPIDAAGKTGLLGPSPQITKVGTPSPSTGKPSLLGTPPSSVGKPIHGHGNKQPPGMPNPDSGSPNFNRPPPNLNDQPLEFKKFIPELGEKLQPDLSANTDDAASGFLKSASSEGIPGLDLVKDAKDDPKDEPNSDENCKEKSENQKPDLEAISRGINSILGDQKLMNMLSLVSQNQSRPPPSVTVNTVSEIRADSPKFSPEEYNQEDYDEYSNQENPDDFYDNRNQSAFANDEQTRSSFNVCNEPEDFDNSRKSSDYFDGKPSEFNSDFRHEANRFGRGPNNWSSGPDHFTPGSDNFNRGPDNFNRGSDNFKDSEFNRSSNNFNRGQDNFNRGRNDFNRSSDNFNRGPDNFNKGPDNFNRGPENFNKGPDNFKPGVDNFNRGAENFNKGSDNFNVGGDSFNRGPDNFNRGPDNFNRGPDNFNRGPDNFNRGPDNFNRGPDNFNRGPDNFNRGLDNFNRGPDSFNRGAHNFNRGRGNFNRGPSNFNRGPDSFNRGPDSFNRGPDNFNRGPNQFNRNFDESENFNEEDEGSDNLSRDVNRSTIIFSKDSDNFNSSDGFNRDTDNFNRGPENFNRGSENLSKDSGAFDNNRDNFNRGFDNFNRGSDRFGRGTDFNKRSEEFNRDSDNFNRSSGPNNSDRGAPGGFNRSSDFNNRGSNFNREPGEEQKGFNIGKDSNDHFEDEFNRFNRPPPDNFSRGPKNPNIFNEGTNNFNEEQTNFNRPPPNFDGGSFNKGPNNESGRLEPTRSQQPELDWSKSSVSNDPAPLQPTETKTDVEKADEGIWKPKNVIDYDHKSIKISEQEVILEPLHTFDYRHKPFNRIPYPQRPKWLSDMVKNYPEFDLVIPRSFETHQLRRYPVNERFDSYQKYEDRDRKQFDDRDRKSYNEWDRKPYDDRERKPYDDRERKPYDDRERKPYDDRERKPYDDRERKPYDDRERKPYDDRERRPYDVRDRKPYEERDRKSFEDRDRKSYDDPPPRKVFDSKGFDDRRPRGFDREDRKHADDPKLFVNKKPYPKDSENQYESGDDDNSFNKPNKEQQNKAQDSQFSSDKNVTAKTATPNVASRSNVTLIEDLLSPPGRFNRPPRVVIILRGPSGSGKSFLAKLIKDKEVENGGSAPRILCLDDYFMVEQEKEVEEDGRKVKTKEMVYEYEECMEAAYRQSLMKAFKKTIADGYFNFIIVDNINDKVKYFGEMWSFAKQNGFQVYICEMELDVQTCTKRNVHGRSEVEIERCVVGWEPTPAHHPTLDATSLIQSGSIPEVEMEEINSPTSETRNEEQNLMAPTSPSERQGPWKTTSNWTTTGFNQFQPNQAKKGFDGLIWKNVRNRRK